MGTGYTRNDAPNNIADGNIINAADLDGEFNAIEEAFGASGHTHDGTSAEGGPITVLGPAQDFVASATEIKPKTTNTLDIGTNSLLFKDLFLGGVATLGSIKIANAGTIGSASDGDAIAISSSGVVTFSQAPLVDVTNSTTNAVTDVLGIRVQSSGTPAVGIGSGFTLGVETAAGNVETGGAIRIVSTGLTPTSEEIDLVFYSMRNGSLTEAFRFDSSADSLSLNDSVDLSLGSDDDLVLVHSGSAGSITNATGNFTIDAAADIIIDADGGNIRFKDDGTEVGTIVMDDGSNTFILKSAQSDANIKFNGVDGGSGITALTLDMSAAGKAIFNAGSTFANTVVAYGNGSASFEWGDTTTLGTLSFDGSANPVVRSASSKPLVFQTNGANERMRIDSSGNLLVGKTSTGLSTTGIDLRSTGLLQAIRNGGTVVELNRQTSDGTIIDFRKDNSTVGSIGTNTTSGQSLLDLTATQNFRVLTSGNERLRIDSSGGISLVSSSSGLINLNFTDALLSDYARIEGGKSGSGVGDLRFSTYSGSLSEAMRIDSSGRVGIGQTNLSSMLHVRPSSDTTSQITMEHPSSGNSYGGFVRSLSGTSQGLSLGGYFNGTSTETMRIDNSGSVGIGCTPDSTISLDVQNLSASSNNVLLRVKNTTNLEDTGIVIDGNNGGQREYIVGVNTIANSSDLTFSGPTGYRYYVGSTETMRITSSGHLLIGKTVDDNTTAGIALHDNGFMSVARSSDTAMILDRHNSDGEILRFTKSGSTVGSVGVSGNDFYVAGPATNIAGAYFADSKVMPMKSGSLADGQSDLGSSSYRWRDLYLSGGIYLGGTGAANKLDDLESGDWTPQDSLGNNWTQSTPAKYYKIGDLVTCWFDITYNASIGNRANELRNFPLTSDSGPNYAGTHGYTTDNNGTVFHLNSNSTDASFYVGSTPEQMTGRLIGSITYRTA